jgi:hypothetical protein
MDDPAFLPQPGDRWRYQLLYQLGFMDGDREQLNNVIELESQLIDATADDPIAEVDGHDAGSGTMNIFLLTNAPQDAHRTLQPIVRASAANYLMGGAPRRLSGARR